MQYRLDKYGNALSVLGFGCLRFPQKNGKIDMDATRVQIRRAVEEGVNYFDTAYVYSGSEAALGEILESEGLRDRVKIATKLPHYLIKSPQGLEKMFREELKRLRTDRVEYYLMHMLCDLDTWERLKKLGIEEWIARKKASGEIGQIGFSYHGGTDMFCKLVDAYDWDFCQIQYNYMDEHSQAGRRGLYHAHSRGIPVVIMEPLRGGKLVDLLPEEARKVFTESGKGWTPAQWGLRWLWDQEAVTVVLSGMNSEEMIAENIASASSAFFWRKASASSGESPTKSSSSSSRSGISNVSSSSPSASASPSTASPSTASSSAVVGSSDNSSTTSVLPSARRFTLIFLPISSSMMKSRTFLIASTE